MQQNAEKLNAQAIELSSKGEYPEAIACFISALHIEKDNYLLWFNLGVTYRDSGNLRAAKKALLTAYKLNQEDQDVLDTLALVCYAMGDMTEAFYYTEEALSINPKNSHTWNNLGVLYFSQEKYEDAAEAFEQAVSLFPNYYDALYNLRDTYEELGNTVGANECNERMKALPKGNH